MVTKLKDIKKIAAKVRGKKSSSKPQYIVGLDIGTEFVKVLIAKVADDQLQVIGVGRAHQGLTDMQAGAISDIAGVVENCDKALNEADEELRAKIRAIEEEA